MATRIDLVQYAAMHLNQAKKSKYTKQRNLKRRLRYIVSIRTRRIYRMVRSLRSIYRWLRSFLKMATNVRSLVIDLVESTDATILAIVIAVLIVFLTTGC